MNDVWKITGKGLANGMIAGLVGTTAMTLSEKLEQALTGRPDSYIPAHTVERFFGLPTKPDSERKWINWAAHWGLGVGPAALRGVMAESGMRGPLASTMFFITRMTTDELGENLAGVGKPPWSWKAMLSSVDVLHKGVYAFATGAVADKLASTPPPLARRTGGHGPQGSF